MTSAALSEPLDLARALIRCPSVTPHDAGALDVLEKALESIGFECHRLIFSDANTPEVANLYARRGSGAPNFCFAGHTDVVPAGSRDSWTVDPFGGDVIGGKLFGRGAADMKGAIACFVAAAARYLAAHDRDMPGSVSLLITGDEEGPATNGTAKVLRWMAERGERIDACLVGEPTGAKRLGDTVKIGRRGSLTAHLAVYGVQGHAAYPHLADNPIPKLIRMLESVAAAPFDSGTSHFQPSTLAITTVDVGNTATNVIPAKATASLNIRFNDLHSGESLTKRLREIFDKVVADMGGQYDLTVEVSGEAFLSPPGRLSEIVAEAIESRLGPRPDFNTAGGTSDARFIHRYCPVAEFGLLGATMHKVDECVTVADLEALTAIYVDILERFFRDTESARGQ
ncbi:MAG TPA: succinyl-diaminopimelate desuccinylase [Alphaproteobacteria bacterium]|nr:succinyl-diaminopimelate desuccinylase [Alphaproteobacteria bacterium]